MKQVRPQVLAENLVQLTITTAPLLGQMEQLKAELRAWAGQSFETTDGSKVTISKASEDRVEGLTTVFNEIAYLQLPLELRSQLEVAGVVKVLPKVIKAATPKVTVKLAA